jgi:hypothetical protein
MSAKLLLASEATFSFSQKPPSQEEKRWSSLVILILNSNCLLADNSCVKK